MKIKDIESKTQISKMMTDTLSIIQKLEDKEFNRFYVELWNDKEGKMVYTFNLEQLAEGSRLGLLSQLKNRYKQLEHSLLMLKL